MGNTNSNIKIPLTFSTDKTSLKNHMGKISSLAHVDKESILLKFEDDKYYLTFTFSTRVRSTIQIYLCANYTDSCEIVPDIPIIAL